MPRTTLSLFVLIGLAVPAVCQQPVPLIDAQKPIEGWGFGNGPEFPGAQGKLEVAPENFRDKPVLSLHGDFTKGGNYVHAWVALPKDRIDSLSFWVNSPAGSKRLPIRYTDAADKVHQINLKINEKGGWQHLVLPVARFFKTMGTSDALDIVAGYETWDGAKDSEKHKKEHPPVPNLSLLASRAMGTDKGTVLLSDVLFHPSTTVAAAVTRTIPLDEVLQSGELDWGFNLGQEFAGARGGLDLVRDQPTAGKNAMRLYADFTSGGAYVGVRKSFSRLGVQATNTLRLKMRSETASSYALRLVDGTGQCHQRKEMPFKADGKWQDVALVPTEIAGGEHWGGANDGQWHEPLQLIELMLNVASHEGKKPALFITDMRADVSLEASVQTAAFKERFESGDKLPERWQAAGDVRLDSPGNVGSQKALRFRRSLEELQDETAATSPAFAVKPGAWQVAYAWKAKLHSPDNSYHASVVLETLNGSGGVIEAIPVAISFGEKDWQTAMQTVTIPRDASQARFRIGLAKTYGSFWLDDLSAAPLSTQPIESRIERILLATDAVGNLFLPGDPLNIRVTVEAIKPLDKDSQTVRYSVRDYWGAPQITPGEVPLQKGERKKEFFTYSAEIRLPPDSLATGKYHELHVEVPQGTDEPAREYSGLAVLPPAPTKNLAPEQVPFTIRNWDSRIPVYFHLADRLGLRLLGVWGGWDAKAPYKPHLPGEELCKQLGAKWITGTPAANIEREGFATYSEEALRQGMKNFLEKFADKGLAMIAMGNEPHGTGQKVLDNVRAYRAIYETVKAHDPKIHVIGTSVEPNEEYFRAGYQKYLDSYDFHIYEHYTNVRQTMHEYRDLMKKYNAVKPIHSTELGLNSQGQTRHAAAVEMIKKFTVFFAEGGATVSWFTIQYPDPNGKARGQFGDAHCVFDCKYSLYNPRLDAITYYHILNGIADKKFVEERQYPEKIQAYLFRDQAGNCLQVLWLDDERREVFTPLPAMQTVEVVALDGSRTTLNSAVGGVTLTASPEPLLLSYRDPRQGLAPKLGVPALSLAKPPDPIASGGTSVFTVQGPGLRADSLRVTGPLLWKATAKQAGADRVEITVQAPTATSAREARISVQLHSASQAIGEAIVPLRL